VTAPPLLCCACCAASRPCSGARSEEPSYDWARKHKSAVIWAATPIYAAATECSKA
jgi:hypothetical protein